jgi:MSHA biogenesis protein MshN
MKVTPIELTREQETELDVKAANIALSQGNIDKAIESYMSILSRDQKNRQAREKIASLYFGTNNISQAKKVLQQGIGLDPAYPNYRLLLARILMDQGARTEALSVLTSLSLRAESGNLDYIATEASLATELNQPAIAIDAYSKLTRIMPNDGKWWFGLGLSFDRQNMKSAAVTNYKRAIDVGVAEASRKFALQRIQELEK